MYGIRSTTRTIYFTFKYGQLLLKYFLYLFIIISINMNIFQKARFNLVYRPVYLVLQTVVYKSKCVFFLYSTSESKLLVCLIIELNIELPLLTQPLDQKKVANYRPSKRNPRLDQITSSKYPNLECNRNFGFRNVPPPPNSLRRDVRDHNGSGVGNASNTLSEEAEEKQTDASNG